MADIAAFLNGIIGLFKIEATLFGFTISMWQIFLVTFLGGVLVAIIKAALD